MLDSYFNYFLAAFTSLFTIVNPLGMMPVFLGLTASDTSEYRNWQAKRACLFMIGILAFFLFAGTFIMNFFGISLESLRIAGGIIIVRAGLGMLNSDDRLSKKSKLEALEKTDISLTPLAIPLLSGPGSIAATISLASQSPDFVHNLVVLLSIFIVGLIAFLVFRVSNTLLPWIGRGGLEAVTKIMGFIAMTVGVQFFINGIYPLIQGLIK